MSIDTPSLPDLRPFREARPVHARWSELNGEFLDFAAGNPEYLERESFASLSANPSLRAISLQSWPFFLGAEQRRELERMALGMDRLVKGAVERFLLGDFERVREFYRVADPAEGERAFRLVFRDPRVLAWIMEEPNGFRGAPSRADYLEDADGLKCLEYNAGSFLGGMQLNDFGNLYLACPPVARFLEAKGRRARAPDTLCALFRHQVEEAARLGAWSGGELNVAVVNRPNPEAWAAMFVEEVYTAALRRVLEERGIPGGRAILCSPRDFREENGALFVGEHPVHLVLEYHSGVVRLRLQYRYFKMGRLQISGEPVGRILSDKANLALLSENARSDEFTAEERALIERHVPWTRRVAPMRTDFRGRGLRIPDDLAERRAELVLKKSGSVSGRGVLVGRFRTDAEWRDDLARAAREEDWIVQEYLESVPCCFQAGERGAARHDVVWGLFAFGDHFGGVFTRMMPRTGEGGVVNTSRGAQEGTFLELED